MTSFKKIMLHGAAAAVVAASLAGCSSSDNRATPTPSPTPTPTGGTTVRQEDQFGMGFAAAFRSDNNGEPKTVSDGDSVAVSATTEPVAIN